MAYRVWSSNRFAAPVVTMGDGSGSDEADIGDAFGQLGGRPPGLSTSSSPFRHVRDLITTIPGISTNVADVVVAETGADMDQFPSPGHLASGSVRVWANSCLLYTSDAADE